MAQHGCNLALWEQGQEKLCKLLEASLAENYEIRVKQETLLQKELGREQ